MSFYPILKAPGCRGWTTLCNFSPNNWESSNASEKLINVTWPQEGFWRTENIGVLKYGEMKKIGLEEVAGLMPPNIMPFLSLTLSELPAVSRELPQLDIPITGSPAWRASLGLSSALSSTSYQGELDPFPESGSLLTFGPLIQFGDGIENFLILLNLEKTAISRTVRVEIFDSKKKDLKGTFELSNNDATAISLDGLDFKPTDLPLIICRDMSSIPIYFSRTSDGSSLSLEHTHPPASYVIHGKRWAAQKVLKNLWFSKATPI
jgi:hypothetical protein